MEISSVVTTAVRAGQAEAAPASATSATQIVARLERLPFTPLHLRARLVVGSATFFDGFDTLAIASVLAVLASLWKLTPQEIGVLVSAGFFGQALGSLIFAALAERVGRLRAASWSVGLFALGSLLSAWAWDYNSMLVCRVVQGLGLGGELPVAATYINELVRAQGRGRYVILYEVIFPAGLFLASLVGTWVVPHLGWQAMFYIGALPAAVAALMRTSLPESPRWLAGKGRAAEAEAAIVRFEKSAVERFGAAVLDRMPPVMPAGQPAGRGGFRELLQGIYLRRTLVVWAIWITGGVVTYGLTTWLPTLYRTIFGLDLASALRYGAITSLVGLAGAFLAAFAVDRVGRRPWMAAASIASGLSIGALGFIHPLTAVAVLIGASLSFGFLGASFITAYAYTPEIYPTRMRSLGCGVASTVLRIASVIAPAMVGWLVASASISAAFLLVGAVAVTTGVIVALFGIETKGRVLEEIST